LLRTVSISFAVVPFTCELRIASLRFCRIPRELLLRALVTRPSIHRAILRSMPSTPIRVDSFPPMHQQQLITSILPLTLSLSTPCMTPRGTSPRTAPYAPHSRVNINTAWCPFLPATRTMTTASGTIRTIRNPKFRRCSRLPALPSSATLSWRPLRQSLNPLTMALLPFLAFTCRPHPLLNMIRLRPSLD